MTARPAPRPGLSLLEVLVSLTILLIALAALGQLVDLGEDRATRAALVTTGTRLAQSKLAELEAGALDVTAGGSGTCEDEPGWSWSVESAAGGAANLYGVTVRLTRDYKGRPVEVVLSQMICDPNQMGGATAAQPPAATGTTGSGGGS